METKRNVGLATASLVLGILSMILLGLLTAIPAVVCGHVAKAKIRRDPDGLGGESSALAGLIMGYVSIGLSVFVVPILLAMAIPLMTSNMDRAIATEAQAGCSTVSTMLRLHWAEHGSFDGVDSVDDLEYLQPGDLDGMYCDDDDYALADLKDGKNFVVTATYGGEDDIDVTLMFINGEQHWKLDCD